MILGPVKQTIYTILDPGRHILQMRVLEPILSRVSSQWEVSEFCHDQSCGPIAGEYRGEHSMRSLEQSSYGSERHLRLVSQGSSTFETRGEEVQNQVGKIDKFIHEPKDCGHWQLFSRPGRGEYQRCCDTH